MVHFEVSATHSDTRTFTSSKILSSSPFIM
ncbi:hypothetical protein NPIL_32201, partial [Nephila pilipes]